MADPNFRFDRFWNRYLLVKCMMGISGIIAFKNKASQRQNSQFKETLKVQRNSIFSVVYQLSCVNLDCQEGDF